MSQSCYLNRHVYKTEYCFPFLGAVLNPHLNSHRERQSLLEATKPGRVSVLEVGRRRAREAQQEEMNKKSIEALVERKLKKAEEIRKKRVDPPPIKGRRLGRKDEQSSRSPLMPITAHTSTYRYVSLPD